MAQVFITKEEREQQEREALIQRAMQLWADNAAEYRILPIKYFFLLEEKRRAGMPLRKINNSRIDEYPDVCLFRFFDEESARVWLEEKKSYELKHEIEEIEYILHANHAYVSLKSWTTDALYALAHQKRPRANSLVR